MATWAVPASIQILLSLSLSDAAVFDAPVFLFWIVVVAASLCVVTSMLLIVRSFRTNEAELGLLGLFFLAVSVFPLVHGLTTPGVLFDDNTTSTASVLLAIPAGLLAVLPFSMPRRLQPAVLRRSWKQWIGAASAVFAVAGVALLVRPDLLPAPQSRDPLVLGVAAVSFAGCVALSRRHLRMARIAERHAPLVVSLGFGSVGASAFVWLAAAPFSAGFWGAHVLDITGVFAATIGGWVVYRRSDAIRPVFRAVLVAEPMGALEIGLDPIVHRFVADLEAKDPITRDHVVRTAELSILLGEELGLGPSDLRRLGLAAILHDVGKLSIPDFILGKPGRLTAAEFQVVRTHAIHGEILMRSSEVLADIAPAVRGHHERLDGGGYPDGLEGMRIPRDARIIAVVDAFDAMSNTRQYREGMGIDVAIAILREHAGTQWDPVIVEALVTVVSRDPPAPQPASALDATGRIGCDCVPRDVVMAGVVGSEGNRTAPRR